MESLYIKATNETPEVSLNAETGRFCISGISLPESPIAFYKPVLDWLTIYLDVPKEETVFDFKMKHFNSSSSKQLIKLLFILECISNSKKVIVNWHYRKNDAALTAFGTEYAKVLKLNFNMIETE